MASTASSCTLEVKDDALRAGQDQDQRRRGPRCRTSTPALLTIIGTPNNLAVWDTLNDECMPQLLNGTGHPQLGRRRQPPVDHRPSARLRLRGRPVGVVAAGGAPGRHEGRRDHVQQRLRQDLRDRVQQGASRAPTSRSSSQQFHEPTAPDLNNQFTTAGRLRCRRAAARDDRHVLHPGDGRGREEHDVEPDRDHVGDVHVADPVLPAADRPGPHRRGHAPGPSVEGRQRPRVRRRPDSSSCSTRRCRRRDSTTPRAPTPQGWLVRLVPWSTSSRKRRSTRADSIAATSPSPPGSSTTTTRIIFDGITNQTNGFEDAYLNEGGQMGKYTITDPTHARRVRAGR